MCITLINYIMNKNERNCQEVKNSSLLSTSDYESVDLLFDLTPGQVKDIFCCYYDLQKMCFPAVIEMVKYCQKKNDEENAWEASIGLMLSKYVGILADIDKMRDAYDDFASTSSFKNGEYAENMDEKEKKVIQALYDHFVSIVKNIDDVGVYEFVDRITDAVRFIETRKCYEDMIEALGCAYSLYVAFLNNLREKSNITN